MAELWKRFINFNSDLWNERNEEEEEEEAAAAREVKKE